VVGGDAAVRVNAGQLATLHEDLGLLRELRLGLEELGFPSSVASVAASSALRVSSAWPAADGADLAARRESRENVLSLGLCVR
jgi:hypothetical protein